MVILSVNTQLYRILICVFMSHAKYLEADIDNMKHQRVAGNSPSRWVSSVLIGQCRLLLDAIWFLNCYIGPRGFPFQIQLFMHLHDFSTGEILKVLNIKCCFAKVLTNCHLNGYRQFDCF